MARPRGVRRSTRASPACAGAPASSRFAAPRHSCRARARTSVAGGGPCGWHGAQTDAGARKPWLPPRSRLSGPPRWQPTQPPAIAAWAARRRSAPTRRRIQTAATAPEGRRGGARARVGGIAACGRGGRRSAARPRAAPAPGSLAAGGPRRRAGADRGRRGRRCSVIPTGPASPPARAGRRAPVGRGNGREETRRSCGSARTRVRSARAGLDRRAPSPTGRQSHDMPVARRRVVADGADIGAQDAPACGRLRNRARAVAREAADAAQPVQVARQLVPARDRDRRAAPSSATTWESRRRARPARRSRGTPARSPDSRPARAWRP